jgi:hypothetical protein
MEEKRRGRVSFVGLPVQPMRSMPLERHVILCVKSSLCCYSVCVRQTTQSTEFQKLAGILTRQPRLGVSSTSARDFFKGRHLTKKS